MKYLRKKIAGRLGHTLVELMVALICSSIILFGLFTVYAYGIKQFNSITSRFQMFNEGNIVLRQIAKMIRRAEMVYVIESSDPGRSELHLTDPPYENNGGGEVVFFTNRADHTLRMNDWRVGHNNANKRLLPIRVYRTTNQPAARFPYRVVKMNFQYADGYIDGYDYSGTPYLVRMDLVLQDTLGNTLSLSTTESRLN